MRKSSFESRSRPVREVVSFKRSYETRNKYGPSRNQRRADQSHGINIGFNTSVKNLGLDERVNEVSTPKVYDLLQVLRKVEESEDE